MVRQAQAFAALWWPLCDCAIQFSDVSAFNRAIARSINARTRCEACRPSRCTTYTQPCQPKATNDSCHRRVIRRCGQARLQANRPWHALAFVDFAGNKQYITSGNLSENPKAHLFLMDYAHRQRIKIWGEARVVEGDEELTARLMPPGYKARAEQVIIFTVTAWDANCPQHIPARIEAADVNAALDARDARIHALDHPPPKPCCARCSQKSGL